MRDRRVVWFGAAALALGCSLAGPQAGRASAATGDSPAAGATTASAPARATAVRTGRTTARHADAVGPLRRPFPKSFPSVRLERVQAQVALRFHDLRDAVNTSLPAPLADVVNGGLYLVRRAVLPTGKDVGLLGGASCVKSRDCSGKDLTGGQLDHQDLTGVTWTGVTLQQANLRGSTMSSADFGPASLPWLTAAASQTTANATPSCYPDCQVVDLQGADLEDANLTDANLTQANLSDATLTGATLTDAILFEVFAENANFTSANLLGADLYGANLTSATLVGANLTNANLADANLEDATLYQATLTDANLDGVFWVGTTCPDGGITQYGCLQDGSAVNQ